jgi:hypothetical protein
MPKVSEIKESKFLKKEHVGNGVLATISGVVKKNVAREDATPELKWCLLFTEIDRPLVLNSTNLSACEQIAGSDDTDHWVGTRVVLYTDPNISYAGKLVGGIRIRRPKTSSVATAPPLPPMRPAAEPPAGDEFDDPIPF